MRNNNDKFAITFICGMIGIILAFILYSLNLNGIVVDEFISGTLIIEEVMALTIVVWTLIGVGLAAFT